MIVVTILRLGASKLRAFINACADIDTVTYASSVSARQVPRYAGRDVIGYNKIRYLAGKSELCQRESVAALIGGQ
jgi:hypothetical protein